MHLFECPRSFCFYWSLPVSSTVCYYTTKVICSYKYIRKFWSVARENQQNYLCAHFIGFVELRLKEVPAADRIIGKIIRIFDGCEERFENCVKRITFRYHEACWVMSNSHPVWWRDFQFPFNNHYRFFFLAYSCLQLHLSLNMHYFINFTLK